MKAMTETIEWHEESKDEAPYSDSYAAIDLLLSLTHAPTKSDGVAIVIGQKGKNGEWYIDGYSKDGVLDPIWSVKYWTEVPQGPEAS